MHEVDDDIFTYNAFELKDSPGIIVVFKTRLDKIDRDYIDTLPTEQQRLGQIDDFFHLVGITVADESLLDSIWGKSKIYDLNSGPIELDGPRTKK